MPEKRHAQEPLESPSKRSVKKANSSDSTLNESVISVLQTMATAFDNSRFDDAIAQSSAAFNDLAKNMVQLLDARARAWAKKANTSEEFKDALIMIRIAPDHPAGYLRAGKLYAMQGYQDDAMEMFKNGLDSVQSTDASYASLQHGYEQAKVQSRKRVDFLAKCPHEVGAQIIHNLTDDATFAESTMVSRVWRNKVLANASHWKIYNVGYAKTKTGKKGVSVLSSPKTLCLLPALARHIEEINMEDDPPWFYKSFNLLQTHEFPKLHTMNVYRKYISTHEEKPISSIDVSGVLSTLSRTLTHLYIKHDGIRIPSLATILLICRNLTSIRLHHITAPKVNWLAGLSSLDTTSLTRLSLSAFEERPVDSEIFLNQVGSLLRCSPALEQVEFQYFSDDILPLIARYCHNLSHISFNSTRGFDESQLDDEVDFEPGALRTLILGFPLRLRLVRPLLERYHDTLQALYIVGNNDSSADEWQMFLTYQMPLLSKLYVFYDSGVHAILPAFIRQNRSLQDITLDQFETAARFDVFGAISELDQMETLTIHLSPIDGIPFQTLEHCRLRNLVLNYGFYPRDDILTGIGAIETLESLKIVADECEEVGNIENFSVLLGRLPSLNRIKIENIRFTDLSVRNLCASRSLEKAKFSGYGGISQEGKRLLEERGITIQ